MRIRKHAGRILSSLSIPTQGFAAAAAAADRDLETHVCELNQSPWDVMAFTPPEFSPLYPYQEAQEIEEENGFAGESRGFGQGDEEWADAVSDVSGIHATESTLRRRIKVEETADRAEKRVRKLEAKKRDTNRNTKKLKRKTTSSCATEAAEDDNKVKMEVESAAAATAVVASACKKSDGKGWHCKREAQRPHSLCEYHLTQVRSYYSNGGSTAHPLQHQHQHQQLQLQLQPFRKMHAGGVGANQDATLKKITKKKTTKEGNSSSNGGGRTRRKPESDFYYYYSGFGPWRGKRRSGGEGAGRERKASNVDASNGDDDVDDAPDGAPSLMVHNQAPDDLDDDEDDTDGVDDLGDHEGDDAAASRRRGRKPIKARSLRSLL